MDFYKVLGVSKNATPEEIRAAFKTLAKQYHPDIYKGDKVFAEKKMQEINQANDVLSDPKKREYYDLTLVENDRAEYRRTPRVSNTAARRRPAKAAAKKPSVKPGETNDWNDAFGVFATVFSAGVWVFLFVAGDIALRLAVFTVMSVLFVFLYGGVFAGADVDTGMVGVMFTVAFCVFYYLVRIILGTETLDPLSHFLLLPLFTSVCSFLPARLCVMAIRSKRKKKAPGKQS